MENKPNKFQRETADSFECMYEKKPQADCSWFLPTPIITSIFNRHVFIFLNNLGEGLQVHSQTLT